jgi:hypothetical protein
VTIDADRDAPVFVSADIDVEASPETVWDTLTDLDSWPGWLPDVKSMAADGPFAVGTAFTWRAGPGTIKSEVVTAERPTGAVWKGRTMGIDAVHAWTMESVGPSTTHVHTEESWSGLLPRFLRKVMFNTLKKSLDEGLPAIKVEAERRARQQ